MYTQRYFSDGEKLYIFLYECSVAGIFILIISKRMYTNKNWVNKNSHICASIVKKNVLYIIEFFFINFLYSLNYRGKLRGKLRFL